MPNNRIIIREYSAKVVLHAKEHKIYFACFLSTNRRYTVKISLNCVSQRNENKTSYNKKMAQFSKEVTYNVT